jgi:hypothetical protein
MTLKVLQLTSILLAAAVAGMFAGPWAALTRSIGTLRPEVFLAVVHRMSRNMEPLMKVLMPAALLSMVAVLPASYDDQRRIFVLTLTGFALFVVTLLVTMLIEVPIVKRIGTWTDSTLPDDWQELRDRWGKFHLARIGPAVVGLVLLLVGAVFQ